MYARRGGGASVVRGVQEHAAYGRHHSDHVYIDECDALTIVGCETVGVYERASLQDAVHVGRHMHMVR